MNRLEVLSEEVQKIHRNEFDHTVFSCTEELHSRRDEIKVGPRYNIKTKSGDPLTIHSLYLNGGNSEPYSRFPCYRKFFLYAYSESEELIAQRISLLFRQQNRLEGQGRIDVLRRGKGIAVPLECVHFDILQREANKNDIPLVYQVQNSNDKELVDTRTLFDGRTDGQIIIDQKERENRRWHKLYGPSGVLGFNDRLYRTFYPDFNNDDPFPYQVSIGLRREDSSDLKHTNGVMESFTLLSEEEWEQYGNYAKDRIFQEIKRLSEGVGRYYR